MRDISAIAVRTQGLPVATKHNTTIAQSIGVETKLLMQQLRIDVIVLIPITGSCEV